MSVKDLSKAWDEAAWRALESGQGSELDTNQLADAAGLRVRSGLAAGKGWGGYTEASACNTEGCTGLC